jgi:hypothetical protein
MAENQRFPRFFLFLFILFYFILFLHISAFFVASFAHIWHTKSSCTSHFYMRNAIKHKTI